MKNTWKIIVVAALLSAAAVALRIGLIEPDDVGRLCTGDTAPVWCLVRQWLIAGFAHNYYGYGSLLAVVLALVFQLRALAWLALAAGIFGCLMYRFEPSGAGVLLAALALARLNSEAELIATTAQSGSTDQQT